MRTYIGTIISGFNLMYKKTILLIIYKLNYGHTDYIKFAQLKIKVREYQRGKVCP
jgi:hypothetical protein